MDYYGDDPQEVFNFHLLNIIIPPKKMVTRFISNQT